MRKGEFSQRPFGQVRYNFTVTKNKTTKLQVYLAILLLLVILSAACQTPNQLPQPTQSPQSTNQPTATQPTPTNLPAPATPTTTQPPITKSPITPTPTPIRFAVIGDYGLAGEPAAAVANLVKSWKPDFIITTGDNNYPIGSAETIDQNIGQYYADYIYPYIGEYDSGTAEENGFFPSLGNHDWDAPGIDPYLAYFTLPGNERYYEFTAGPIHLFALNTDSREPDGVSAGSIQAAWLQEELAASDLPWKIVYGHLSPYASGPNQGIDWINWPFQDWGATVLLAGHDHIYERILRNGFPYIINGLGGGPRYAIEEIVIGSEVRYRNNHGAMLLTADWQQITFQFFTIQNELIDSYTIEN
jgi:hypothetical protein